MKIQRTAILVFISIFTAPQAGAVTLEDLVNSSDVVMSEKAQGGATVAIVVDPEKFEGGVKLAGNQGLPQGLKMRDLVAAWRDGDRSVGLGVFVKDPTVAPPPTGTNQIVVNGEFTNDLSGWTSSNAYGGASSFGPITAPASSVDGRFAVATNGLWDASVRGSITQDFFLAANVDATFSIVYNFISTEYPNYIGGGFNDNIIVTLDDKRDRIQFSLFEDANTATFTPVTGLPVDKMYFSNGGQTGWITENSPSLFLRSGGPYTITIEVNDVGDEILDSAILVDRVGLVF